MFAYQGAYSDTYKIEPLDWSRFFKLFRRKREDEYEDEETEETDGRSACSYTDSRRKRRKHRVPSMVKETGTYLIIPALRREEKATVFTLILDLDETLAFGRQGPIVKRPYLARFLKYANSIPNCEVVVWTAGIRSYAQRIITAIDPEGVIKHCVYRHHKWYPGTGGSYTKNLALTGRHPDRTLIIDNTPDCVTRNVLNGIVCQDFVGGKGEADVTLLALIDVIKNLVASDLAVPDFVSTCADLKLLPVKDAYGRKCCCYFLDESRWGGPGVDSTDTLRKINRDLQPPSTPLNPLGGSVRKHPSYGST
eukprot:TRINITY_DN467_c2_g1_i1.p1 TRINITY_DN467_c2_g1~~TRINITY_DN467_c2_g1_i1.p1  ORF type:complete len:333 (+),score=31.65 TRINITY_DN467_c2_g1_i1:77-1000(+)